MSNRDLDSNEYKSWRFGVFARDGWICVKCSTKGKTIEAHHIKRWADEPRLRYVVSNGVTLCKDCHEMVTGREDLYQEEFRRIVAQSKKNYGGGGGGGTNRAGKVPSLKPAFAKWRRKNPRNRY